MPSESWNEFLILNNVLIYMWVGQVSDVCNYFVAHVTQRSSCGRQTCAFLQQSLRQRCIEYETFERGGGFIFQPLATTLGTDRHVEDMQAHRIRPNVCQ